MHPLPLLPLAVLLLENTEVPPPVRAMLDAAYESGNERDIATVVKYARVAAPQAADAIEDEAKAWRAKRRRAQEETLASASIFDLWKGRAEVGGFISEGNTNLTGLTAIVDLQREGLSWRHKFRMQADYQESGDVTVRERYLFSYEPNYKIDDGAYIYGAALAESDRFLGYDSRFSLSAGAGYGVIREPDITLNVDLGPAFRETDFTDDTTQSSLAARGSVDLDWRLTPAITFRNDGSAYLQRFNSTVSNTTALNARLFGPLSAQLSYAVQYESMPPIGRRNTDTTSRASLVYSF